MNPINLANRTFRLLENSNYGAVSESTYFYCTQHGDIVSATYKGGDVLDGQILATWRTPDQLEMRYHCIMADHSLQAGKAIALAKVNKNGLIELHLDWQWLDKSLDTGSSIYIEVAA